MLMNRIEKAAVNSPARRALQRFYEVPALLRLAGRPLPEGGRAVEIGCGSGYGTRMILDRFQAVVTADDVKRGKPAPDIFLEAARQLSVDPTLCMAFEDANLGIQSATAAGMHVVDVRPYYKKA